MIRRNQKKSRTREERNGKLIKKLIFVEFYELIAHVYHKFSSTLCRRNHLWLVELSRYWRPKINLIFISNVCRYGFIFDPLV